VAVIALTIFSGLTCVYLIHRRYFKSNIEGRLEKNRQYAEVQRQSEKSKNFIVDLRTAIPEFFFFNNGITKKPLIAEEKRVNGKVVGIASCQGKRYKMEDADLAADFFFKVQDQSYPVDVFGIFDGHGGSEVSRFVKNHLIDYLKKALEKNNEKKLTQEGIFKALKDCFIQLDKDFPEETASGTTATVAIILDGMLWVANAGDSGQILAKENRTIVRLTEEAKPHIPRYKKTIEEKLKGSVVNDRVNGMLGVARAIGDKMIKGTTGECCVSPKPKITCYSLDELKGDYLVLACDGLYKVASSNEVGDFIFQMDDMGKQPGEMAQRLVLGALNCDSGDNVSVMVVKIPD
jgi:serine/threonine protein phosphatase PrpC